MMNLKYGTDSRAGSTRKQLLITAVLLLVLLLSPILISTDSSAQQSADVCKTAPENADKIQITVNSEFYPDARVPAQVTTKEEFDQALEQAAVFVWQQFIAMTWPAKAQDGSFMSRGVPDTSGNYKYGDKGPTSSRKRDTRPGS